MLGFLKGPLTLHLYHMKIGGSTPTDIFIKDLGPQSGSEMYFTL